MRDLHRHRHAVDQHDLVAPVELVGLARREAQRHEGRRRCRAARAVPARGVAPHRVVAALDSRAPRSSSKTRISVSRSRAGFAWLATQQPSSSAFHGPSFGSGCTSRSYSNAVAPERSTLRTVFRETCSSRTDLLDRLAPHEVLAPDPRDRVHALHPPPPVPITRTGSLASAAHFRGSILDADPPPQGVKIARLFTDTGIPATPHGDPLRYTTQPLSLPPRRARCAAARVPQSLRGPQRADAGFPASHSGPESSSGRQGASSDRASHPPMPGALPPLSRCPRAAEPARASAGGCGFPRCLTGS